MSDLVLVTGISGFVGGHVVLQLLNSGYTVRGSLRNMERAEGVRQSLAKAGADVTRLQFVLLDLESDEGWRDAMADVRMLQHVASPFVLMRPKEKMKLIGPAVRGTERALNAALASNVERIVLTSSTAAITYGHDQNRMRRFDESDWTNLEGRYVPPYQESKTLAERRAWVIMEAAGRRRDMVTINPSGILGPLLDNDPGTSASLVLRMLNGQMPKVPRIGFSVVDVRDVAAAHLKAMTSEEVGGRRIPLCENTLPMVAVAKALAEAFPGRPVSQKQLPNWLVRALAPFNDDLKGLAAEFGKLRLLDTKAAVALMGRPLIPAGDAIMVTANSLKEQGLLL